MIHIVYPPGAGGFFLHSVMQLDPQVCSCVSGVEYWQSGATDLRWWTHAERAMEKVNRPCCDRVQVNQTHYGEIYSSQCNPLVTEPLMHKAYLAMEGTLSRTLYRAHIQHMKQSAIVMHCSPRVWQWLVDPETQKNKNYDITEAHRPESYFRSLPCRLTVDHEHLWSHAGISIICDSINTEFDLHIPTDQACQLAESWWQRHLDMGIGSPC